MARMRRSHKKRRAQGTRRALIMIGHVYFPSSSTFQMTRKNPPNMIRPAGQKISEATHLMKTN
jgi:hypothetical protein